MFDIDIVYILLLYNLMLVGFWYILEQGLAQEQL